MEFPTKLKRFNYAAAVLAGMIILVIGILSTMEGILRGIFNHPTTWSLDICQYLLIWAIFLGSAYAFQEKSHVAVDFIREKIGMKFGMNMQKKISITGYLFTIIFVLVLAWNSIDMLAYGIKWGKLTRGTIQIPISWLYSAILIGSIVMTITLFFIILSLISGKKEYL